MQQQVMVRGNRRFSPSGKKIDYRGWVWCSECGKHHPPHRFHRARNGRYATYCRDCTSARDKLRYVRLAQDDRQYAILRERADACRIRKRRERMSEWHDIARRAIDLLLDRGFSQNEITTILRCGRRTVRVLRDGGSLQMEHRTVRRAEAVILYSRQIGGRYPANAKKHPDLSRVLALVDEETQEQEQS